MARKYAQWMPANRGKPTDDADFHATVSGDTHQRSHAFVEKVC